MEQLKYLKHLNKNVSDLSGQTFVITGANSGIGFYTACLLVHKNARVVMACRSIKRANEAKEKILEINPNGQVDILIYDQASFTSIEAFAHELQSKYPKINGFVFNAGIFHPKKDSATSDGFPLTIGTNYLGAFYLNELLTPYFERNEKMHIVCVGSLANIMFQRGKYYKYFTSFKINMLRQYALSKMFLMSNYSNFSLAKKTNVQYSLMHPGVASTNIVSGPSNSYPEWFSKIARNFMSVFMNHPEKSALGIVYLLAKENSHGHYSVPAGLFGISGYPKLIKIPHYLVKIRTEVRDNTLSFFQSFNNSK